ncbi:hypothetical protein WV31_13150 [Magnetospirillum sp. ME-1]|nr:hypothetical protein WV31_13150 [Magnetospirillum sp. ME-1]
MALFAASLIACAWVDPYGERDDTQIHFVSRPVTIAKYRRILGETQQTLVFGTSRSHQFSDQFLGESVLNLHAVYGHPTSVLAFLKTLSVSQRRNISRIVYLLDLHTFRPDGPIIDRYYESPADVLRYHLTNLRGYGRDSINHLRLLWSGAHAMHLHPRGFLVQDRPLTFDGIGRDTPDSQDFDPAIVKRLAEVKVFAETNSIEIRFITPVFSDIHLRRLDASRLIAQRRTFAATIGSYAELSHFPGISDRPELFRDESHLNADGLHALFATYPWPERRVDAETMEPLMRDLAGATGTGG